MKNYRIEKYLKREDWLKARKIGGTDLAKLVNKVARWGNFIELYEDLTSPNKEIKAVKETSSMARGKKAEEHIKELFLLTQPELTRLSPAKSYWLIKRKDYEEITLSPDTLVKDKNTHALGFIEIKLKQIYSEAQIPQYMVNLKEEEPQYYWQNIHYYISMNDCKFGYLVVAFDLQKKNEVTGKWTHDKYIIDSLRSNREDVQTDIDLGEECLQDFILNNLRKKQRPKTILKEEKEKGKIEWNKLSNIKVLKH